MPLWGVAYTFSVALVDQAARPSFKAAPTLAAGDFKVDKDGAGFNNLGSLPTVSPAAGRLVVIVLSATEMQADRVTVQAVDAAGAEWDDIIATIDTINEDVIRNRLATAGAATTITLDASASASDSIYNDLLIEIVGGTGVGQCRTIQAYVGSTKVATVDPGWTVNPDGTSVFAIRAAGRVDVGQFMGVVQTVGAIPAAAAGASGGILISGTNSGTTTLGALTVSGATTLAALSCTTLTASGAVAFQSTFAVTTSTSLAALSATTVTFSGAVAFQSTFAVTTSTSLAALSCTTLTASGAVAFQSTFATTGTTTFNAFTVTNATTLSGAVSLGSTLGVTGTTTLAALAMTTLTASGAVAFQSTFTVTGAFTASAGFVNTYPVGAYYPANVIDSGTAQSATSTTLVLRAAAAFADSELIGATVVIRSATAGAGQRRVITANVGSTDTVTVDAWTTTPTGTIVYDIIGTASQSPTTVPSVNVTQWLGTAVSTPTVAGVPNVNTKTWNDLTTVALPLVPTTAGRTLDVSTGGEAGVDWANVGTPGATVSLSATTVATVTTTTTATAVTTVNGLAASVITAASIATDAITAAKIADGAIDTATFASGTTIPRCTLVDTLTTYTGNTVQTGDSFARIGAAGAGLTALGDTRIANLDATVSSRATPAQVLTTALTESYAADGAAPTLSQALFLIQQHLTEFAISGTTYTTKKLDGAATAATFTLDSSTSPTSITRAS